MPVSYGNLIYKGGGGIGLTDGLRGIGGVGELVARAGEPLQGSGERVGNPSILSSVIHAGLKHAPSGKQAAEDAMGSAIIGENARYQSKIAYLSVIGVIAPMIGLTGTVVGMIQAFAAMGQAGAADPSKLSGAIGHVLHATASGLAVAIPAFIFYYLIRNKVGHSIHALSDAANDLFRKFPYDYVAHIEFEGGESFAAVPNWVEGGPTFVQPGQQQQA